MMFTNKLRSFSLIAMLAATAVLTGCSSAQDASAPSQIIPPGEVVASRGSGIVCLAFQPSLENLTVASGVIVQARITDIQYTNYGGSAWMDTAIQVTEAYKGEYQAGDVFSAYMGGGFIPVKAYNEWMGTTDEFAYLSDEDQENGYIQDNSNYDALPAVGEEYLFFLETGPDYLPAGYYLAVNAAESLYRIDEEQFYSNASNTDTFTKEELLAMISKTSVPD